MRHATSLQKRIVSIWIHLQCTLRRVPQFRLTSMQRNQRASSVFRVILAVLLNGLDRVDIAIGVRIIRKRIVQCLLLRSILLCLGLSRLHIGQRRLLNS